MLAEDRVRLRHMVEAGESAVQFVAGRQRADLDEDRILERSAMVCAAPGFPLARE